MWSFWCSFSALFLVVFLVEVSIAPPPQRILVDIPFGTQMCKGKDANMRMANGYCRTGTCIEQKNDMGEHEFCLEGRCCHPADFKVDKNPVKAGITGSPVCYGGPSEREPKMGSCMVTCPTYGFTELTCANGENCCKTEETAKKCCSIRELKQITTKGSS